MRYLFLLLCLVAFQASATDLKIPNWEAVLARQPIEAGGGTPVYQDIISAQQSCNKIEFLSDIKAWGKKDFWATPKEFYKNGAGDCEDFAICKYYALRKAGFKADDLKIIIGKSHILMDDHAILSVKLGRKEYILDSIDKTITPRKEFIPKYFSPIYEVNESSIKVY